MSRWNSNVILRFPVNVLDEHFLAKETVFIPVCPMPCYKKALNYNPCNHPEDFPVCSLYRDYLHHYDALEFLSKFSYRWLETYYEEQPEKVSALQTDLYRLQEAIHELHWALLGGHVHQIGAALAPLSVWTKSEKARNDAQKLHDSRYTKLFRDVSGPLSYVEELFPVKEELYYDFYRSLMHVCYEQKPNK